MIFAPISQWKFESYGGWQMDRLLGLVGWTWAFLVSILAAGCFGAGQVAAGAVLAISAAIACPATWRFAASREVSIGRGWKIGGAVLTFFAAILLLPTPEGTETKSSIAMPAKPEPSTAEQIASLLASESELPKDAYEARVKRLEQVVSLAPGDSTYQVKLDRLLADKARFEQIRDHPEECIELLKSRGTKVAFGNVLLMDFTMRNYGLSHLKDFVIECDIKGPSGTVMDQNRITLYQMIEAGTTRTFRKVNMGLVNSQSTNASCRINSASIG